MSSFQGYKLTSMWFKNSRIFRLEDDFDFNADTLSEQLSGDRLKPCGPQDTSSSGWVSPFSLDNEDLYCLQSGEAILFTQAIEDKVLPAAVVNQKLQEKVSEIKTSTGNKPGRKQHGKSPLTFGFRWFEKPFATL